MGYVMNDFLRISLSLFCNVTAVAWIYAYALSLII